MGKHYDEALIPNEMRRNFDVYDRIKDLGIDLGTFENNVRSLEDAVIVGVVIQESGIVYLSGAPGGTSGALSRKLSRLSTQCMRWPLIEMRSASSASSTRSMISGAASSESSHLPYEECAAPRTGAAI